MLLTTIYYKGNEFEIDLNHPEDISIPVGRTQSPNAFYLRRPEYQTVESGSFIGDVNRGGSCNVEDISFSPHGNGTHTECNGHILPEHTYVNNLLKRHFYLARLISVSTQGDGNQEITAHTLEGAWPEETTPAEALVIRTLPNTPEKRIYQYSGANSCYFSSDAMDLINSKNIKHLLTDLPSVDKEDDPFLKAHHLFFGHNNLPDAPKTITEMIYVKDDLTDGLYWLDLQIAGFESDASPSKPFLYKIRLKD